MVCPICGKKVGQGSGVRIRETTRWVQDHGLSFTGQPYVCFSHYANEDLIISNDQIKGIRRCAIPIIPYFDSKMPRTSDKTREEKWFLINLIKENYSILSQRILDKESAEAKRQKWDEIFTQCAELGHEWTIGRDPFWLARTKWPGIARDAKEKNDMCRAQGNNGRVRMTDMDYVVLDILSTTNENSRQLQTFSTTEALDENLNNNSNQTPTFSTTIIDREPITLDFNASSSSSTNLYRKGEAHPYQYTAIRNLSNNNSFSSKIENNIFQEKSSESPIISSTNNNKNNNNIPQTCSNYNNNTNSIPQLKRQHNNMTSTTITTTLTNNKIQESRLRYIEMSIELQKSLTYESQLRSIYLERRLGIRKSKYPKLFDSRNEGNEDENNDNNELLNKDDDGIILSEDSEEDEILKIKTPTIQHQENNMEIIKIGDIDENWEDS